MALTAVAFVAVVSWSAVVDVVASPTHRDASARLLALKLRGAAHLRTPGRILVRAVDAVVLAVAHPVQHDARRLVALELALAARDVLAGRPHVSRLVAAVLAVVDAVAQVALWDADAHLFALEIVRGAERRWLVVLLFHACAVRVLVTVQA